jgi:hypothetical protein
MIAATLHPYAGAFFTRSRCPGPGVQAGKLSSRTAEAGVAPCRYCSPRHVTGAGQPGRARRDRRAPGLPADSPGGSATRPAPPWPGIAHQRPAPAAGTAGPAPPQAPRTSPPASPRQSRSRPQASQLTAWTQAHNPVAGTATALRAVLVWSRLHGLVAICDGYEIIWPHPIIGAAERSASTGQPQD